MNASMNGSRTFTVPARPFHFGCASSSSVFGASAVETRSVRQAMTSISESKSTAVQPSRELP
jgi:hypothetical protein